MIRGTIILSILHSIITGNIYFFSNWLFKTFSIYLKTMENTLSNTIGLSNPSLVLMVDDSSDNDESIKEDKYLEETKSLNKGKRKAEEELTRKSMESAKENSSASDDIESEDSYLDDSNSNDGYTRLISGIKNHIKVLIPSGLVGDNRKSILKHIGLALYLKGEKLLEEQYEEEEKKGQKETMIYRGRILPQVPDYWNHNSKTNTTSDSKNVEKFELSSGNSKETLSSTLSLSSNANITENENKLDNTLQKKEVMDNPIKVSNDTKTLLKESTSEKPKQTPIEYVAELESAEPISYIWEDGD